MAPWRGTPVITRQDHLTNQEVSSPLEGGGENYSNDITGVNLVFGLWRQQPWFLKKLGCRVKHEYSAKIFHVSPHQLGLFLYIPAYSEFDAVGTVFMKRLGQLWSSSYPTGSLNTNYLLISYSFRVPISKVKHHTEYLPRRPIKY